MGLFWEMYQSGRIAVAEASASTAQNAAVSAESTSKDLLARTESLALMCQAMWELLRERAHMTDDELIAKIKEVDLRDGSLDGKIGGVSRACPKCNRRIGARLARCMYCGHEVGKSHLFKT